MNLFLLVCVVVCLIIVNSFIYKYNSFYFKINNYYRFIDEINPFRLELKSLMIIEMEYFGLKIRIK